MIITKEMKMDFYQDPRPYEKYRGHANYWTWVVYDWFTNTNDDILSKYENCESIEDIRNLFLEVYVSHPREIRGLNSLIGGPGVADFGGLLKYIKDRLKYLQEQKTGTISDLDDMGAGTQTERYFGWANYWTWAAYCWLTGDEDTIDKYRRCKSPEPLAKLLLRICIKHPLARSQIEINKVDLCKLVEYIHQ
jgi:hypothetical protein